MFSKAKQPSAVWLQTEKSGPEGQEEAKIWSREDETETPASRENEERRSPRAVRRGSSQSDVQGIFRLE